MPRAKPSGFDLFQRRHRALAFPVGVLRKYVDDRGPKLAALVSYYSFIAVFPAMLIAVTILGAVLKDNPELQEDILETALADVPILGTQITENLGTLDVAGVAAVVGVVGLVWSSLAFARAGQVAMGDVWNVPEDERPRLAQAIGRSLLTLGVVGLAVVAATAVALSVEAMGVPGGIAVEWLSSGVMYVLGLVLAFRTLTPRSVPFRWLWPGGVAAGIGVTVIMNLFNRFFVRSMTKSSELYGFFGTVLGLFVLFYLMSQVVLVCAEANVVWFRRHFPRGLDRWTVQTPADHAVALAVASTHTIDERERAALATGTATPTAAAAPVAPVDAALS